MRRQVSRRCKLLLHHLRNFGMQAHPVSAQHALINRVFDQHVVEAQQYTVGRDSLHKKLRFQQLADGGLCVFQQIIGAGHQQRHLELTPQH